MSDVIAAAAGVTRQTVYAHYPSREVLLAAVVDRISTEALAAIDAVRLDEGPAVDALLRLVETSWQTFERYPLLLRIAPGDLDPGAGQERHQPFVDRLLRLVRRGQRTGEIDRGLRPHWLVTAVIALGHAAGEEVRTGRMSARAATAALRVSLVRLLGVQGADAAAAPRMRRGGKGPARGHSPR
ncbi:TetR/AcrR family transcriptional regulator [Actinopolymorpha sp. NPDC004070]|uniref:TetR/AcrR family transcriptional regulator n=1 Tax=Actinopolymorpha sp. NPDC004070 TaxID=3154548 RepID=UPI00339DC357